MNSTTTDRAEYMLGYGWGLIVGCTWGLVLGASIAALGVYLGWKA